MSMNRREFVGRIIVAMAGAAALPAGFAQQRGSLKIYVGFPPGGLPDLVARALAEQFRRSFDVTAIVENRPGANGRIAGQAVKNGAPDGTVFLIAPASGIVHLPHVYNDLGFDPMMDFVPVAQLVENDFAFAVSSKIPVDNLKEFAIWCARNPERAVFASPGLGSSPHFMGVTIAKAIGAKMIHVPYKGNNFALNDLQGGHIASMIASTSFLLQPHKTGFLRILATTANARTTSLPQVPTFGELGYGQLTLTEGIWLMAPAKMPSAMVDRFAASAIESLKSKEMMGVINGQAVPAPLVSRELAKVMREEFDKRGAAIREAGFSATK